MSLDHFFIAILRLEGPGAELKVSGRGPSAQSEEQHMYHAFHLLSPISGERTGVGLSSVSAEGKKRLHWPPPSLSISPLPSFIVTQFFSTPHAAGPPVPWARSRMW